MDGEASSPDGPRHRLPAAGRPRPRDVLSTISDSWFGEAVADLALGTALLGLYAGLTALYRTAPLAAFTVVALVAVITGAGAASLSFRRTEPPLAERVIRALALGFLFLAVTAAALVGPVLVFNVLLNRAMG